MISNFEYTPVVKKRISKLKSEGGEREGESCFVPLSSFLVHKIQNPYLKP